MEQLVEGQVELDKMGKSSKMLEIELTWGKECSYPYVNMAHSSMGRPIDQWAAKDGWASPPINHANGRPIHQWAQPTHQYDGHNNI